MNELAMYQGGAIQGTQRPLTADLYNDFVNYLDAAPKTVQTYTRALRQMMNYFSLNGIRNPQRTDLLAFKEDLKASGHKPTTIQNYITAARLFFQWTAANGYYPNIAEHIKGAKLDRSHKKDYLTSGQVKEILSGIDRDTLQGLRDYAMLSLMITCGLRTVEVNRADIADLRTVADNTVIFVQGKGHEEKNEYIKVSAPVEKALRSYLKARGATDPAAPLFASTSHNNAGERMSTRSISAIAKGRMQAAGYDSTRLTAHSLRHTAVTLSLLAGKDITEVQQFARHANIATTMIYNHALDKNNNTCSAAITDAIF